MASSATEDPSFSALTDYEKRRLENVKRNQAMIAALGIQNAKTEMQSNAGKRAEVKGYKRSADKRKRERELVVTRCLRSSRVSWASKDEQKVESSPPIIKPEKHTLTVENTRKSMSLASVCIQGSSTESFISRLQDLDDKVPLSRSPNLKRLSQEGTVEPSDFSLQRRDIARVVPERIMSVVFLPVRDQLVVVAGDKGGHVGFWDVECDDSERDVVHVYQPHIAPVVGLSVASFSATKVFTCSYDGTIKQLDTETSMFDLMYCAENDELFSAICSAPGSPHCVWIGEGLGTLKMLDTRQKTPSSCVNIHHRRINTIDLNLQSPWLMVTSSTDATVCVWDARNLKSASDSLGTIQHQKAVQSAQFSPSGSSIATCSYDNTVAILKGSYKNLPNFIAHPNMNNRWISTFRAIWGWDDEYVYVGNMKRTIDVISSELKGECHSLSSPLMTSIPCRLAAHPLRQGILAGCSAGGQVFVWRQ